MKKEVIYLEKLQQCTISENTKNFIACLMLLHDLKSQIIDAIVKAYGATEVDEQLGKKMCSDPFNALDMTIKEFITEIIEKNVKRRNFNEI